MLAFDIGSNDYAMLIFCNEEELGAGMFDADGTPKHWAIRPRVEPFKETRGGKIVQQPVADISALVPGSFVLSPKGYAALSDFLGQFGQFLELECNGETWYYYNVTNVIDCIDLSRSVMNGNYLKTAAYNESAIPLTPQVFKSSDKRRRGYLYLNDAARVKLQELVTAAGLTGFAVISAN